MRFTVSMRIFGGFAAVLIFVVGLLVTSLSGTSRTNSGLSDIRSYVMPMMSHAGSMVSNLLQVSVTLSDFKNSRAVSAMDEMQQAYEQKKGVTQSFEIELGELSQSDESMHDFVREVIALNAQVFVAGDELILLHREARKLHGQVQDQNKEFIDVLDETTRNSSELERRVVYSLRGPISKFTALLEKLGSAAKVSLGNTMPSEVEIAGMEAKASFNNLDVRLDQLQVLPGVPGSSKLKALVESYQRVKELSIGDQGIFDRTVDALHQQSLVAKKLEFVNQLTLTGVEKIDQLILRIESMADNIQVSSSDTVSNTKAMLLGTGLITLLVSVFVAYFIARSIRNPLLEIVRVVKRIETGDLTQHCTGHDHFHYSGELGELATGMNALIRNLRDIIQDIDANSQQLVTIAEQTAAIYRHSYNSVSHQKEQTQMVATALEEMGATVEEVSRSSNSTLAEVETAYAEVTQGEGVIKENIENIKNLAKGIEHSAGVIEKLNQHSNDIGGVLDVIRSVAEQTNLLALNAAIEAARAGEQGRGFAVVADEVRTLASRAHQSTAEIQEMVQVLQAGAKEAVETMNVSREEAQMRVESIASAGHVLTAIATSMTAIKDMSHQIATAAEEQSCTTQEQNRNILKIAEAAEETLNASQENSATNEQLVGMIEAQRQLLRKFTV